MGWRRKGGELPERDANGLPRWYAERQLGCASVSVAFLAPLWHVRPGLLKVPEKLTERPVGRMQRRVDAASKCM